MVDVRPTSVCKDQVTKIQKKLHLHFFRKETKKQVECKKKQTNKHVREELLLVTALGPDLYPRPDKSLFYRSFIHPPLCVSHSLHRAAVLFCF